MRSLSVSLTLAGLCVGTGLLLSADDKSATEKKPAEPSPVTEKDSASSKGSTKLSKADRALIQKELERFNGMIGGWRGVGQVRRGSTQGAWQETGSLTWRFSESAVEIEYTIKDGKYLKTALVSWDPPKKQYTMQGTAPEGTRRDYRGEWKDGVLILESDADTDGLVSRVSIRQLNEQRVLVLYEQRKATQSLYLRLGEVGYTREGTRLATSDQTGPECVVSGGAGTIKVMYKGETWYVCCTGCKDAFESDPEGIIAEYKAKKAQPKK